MKTWTRNDIKSEILRFAKKFEGKKVKFCELSPKDKFAYVLTDQYFYHEKIVGVKEALGRALRMANRHKERGYDIYEMKVMNLAD